MNNSSVQQRHENEQQVISSSFEVEDRKNNLQQTMVNQRGGVLQGQILQLANLQQVFFQVNPGNSSHQQHSPARNEYQPNLNNNQLRVQQSPIQQYVLVPSSSSPDHQIDVPMIHSILVPQQLYMRSRGDGGSLEPGVLIPLSQIKHITQRERLQSRNREALPITTSSNERHSMSNQIVYNQSNSRWSKHIPHQQESYQTTPNCSYKAPYHLFQLQATGKSFVSTYQKLQHEKVRSYMENQAKQMDHIEREKEMGVVFAQTCRGGTLTGQQTINSGVRGDIFKGSPSVERQKTGGQVHGSGSGSSLKRSRETKRNIIPNTLGDGIIISKINVGQQGVTSDGGVTQRKSTQNSTQQQFADYKSKRSNIGQKYYQTLTNGFGHNHFRNTKNYHEENNHTPNLDLECLIKNDRKSETPSRQNSKSPIREPSTEKKIKQGRFIDNKLESTGFTTKQKTNDPFLESLFKKSPQMKVPQISSFKQQHNLHSQVQQNTNGNLKYHVIREMLEKNNFSPEKAKEIMGQQRQAQNNTVSSDKHQSSKDDNIPQQASLVLGESLLLEETMHSVNQLQKNCNSSKMTKRTRKEVTDSLMMKTNSQQSLDKIMVQQQKEIMNVFEATPVKQKGSNGPPSRQRPFQIKISSNSRESIKEPETTDQYIVANKQPQQRKSDSRSGSQPRIQGAYQKQTINSGGQSHINKNKTMRNNESHTRFVGDGGINRWEDTLSVQIRQLPIYNKDGTQMPLQQFASAHVQPDIVKRDTQTANTKASKAEPMSKRFGRSHYQSMNACKHQNMQSSQSKGHLNSGIQNHQVNAGDKIIKEALSNRFENIQQQQYIMNQTTGLFELQRLSINKGSTNLMAIHSMKIEQPKQTTHLTEELKNRMNTNSKEPHSPNNSQNRPIIMPHIEYQKDDYLRQNSKKNDNPLQINKKSIIDSQRASGLIPENANILKNNPQEIRRNSYVPLREDNTKAKESTLIQSQQSLQYASVTANQSANYLVQHSSSLLHQNQLQASKDAVLVINNNEESTTNPLDEFNNIEGGGLSTSRAGHSISITIGNQHHLSSEGAPNKDSASIHAQYGGNNTSMYSQDKHFFSNPLTLQQQQQSETVVNQHVDLSLGPLYQVQKKKVTVEGKSKKNIEVQDQFQQLRQKTDASHRDSKDASNSQGKQPACLLPSLNKKYIVGIQQQLYNLTDSRRQSKQKLLDKEMKLRDSLKRDKEEQEMRETKQRALFNSFERLSKHLKRQRNLQIMTADKSRLHFNDQFHFEQQHFNQTVREDVTQSTSGGGGYWNQQFLINNSSSSMYTGGDHHSNLTMNGQPFPFYSNSVQSRLLAQSHGESKWRRNNNFIKAAMISVESKDSQSNCNNNRFFKALQQENKSNSNSEVSYETTLMRKTRHQMQFAQLSSSARLKNKCQTKGACPIEVAKNSVPIQMQQVQLSRILQVPTNETLEQVPYLKQTCLVEYVKDQWPLVLGNVRVLNNYQFFSLHYPDRKYYNLIIFGAETPVSKCCKQMVIFQFYHGVPDDLNQHSALGQQSTLQRTKTQSSTEGQQNLPQATLKVICSDPDCLGCPLVEKPIQSKSFIESILNTPNGNPLPTFIVPVNVQVSTNSGGALNEQQKHSPVKDINDSSWDPAAQHQKSLFQDEEEALDDHFNDDSHQYLRAGSQSFQANNSHIQPESSHTGNPFQHHLQHSNNASPLMMANRGLQVGFSIGDKRRQSQPGVSAEEQFSIQIMEDASAASGVIQHSSTAMNFEDQKITDISINKYFSRKQSHTKVT